MSLFGELKRRNVFKVAAAYVIVAWLVMQVAEVMGPALRLPEWAISFVAFILVLGFPVAMVLAWAFELTPEGLRRERDVDRPESITHVTGRKLNRIIVGLLVIAVAYLAWDRFTGTRGQPSPASETATNAGPPLAGGKPGVGDAAPREDGAIPSNDKSIAVLPFQNRSANEENAAFFADGVHDEILTNLSKISDLKVISRTSVMAYRDSEKNMRQIGEELGVATLLEGAVQRAGDTVRINVQLIDAKTDEHLWASTYDRQLTAEGVFAIQSEIALAIADALEATLSPEAKAKLQRAPTDSLEAYDLYLRAIQLKDRANWDALEQAFAYLDQSLALDPEFQAAWVLRARVLTELYNTGARTLEAVQVPLEAALARALTLDQASGGAHGARAAYLALLEDPGAMGEFELALRLDPNNIQIIEDYARALSMASQPQRALELTLRARDLDPLSSWVWFRLARLREQLGQLDEALEAYARIRELDPASSLGYGPTAGVYELQGEIARSLYWLHEAWKADPADLDLPNWIIRGYITLGDPDSARAWLGIIADANPEFPMTLANQSILDVEDGRMQDAVRRATRHLAAGHGNRWGSETTVVTVLLMDAVRREDPGPALDLLRSEHSRLFQQPPAVDASNVLLALDAAQLMLLDGQREAAESLLRAAIRFSERPNALTGSTNSWRVTARARALALLGEKEAALGELEKWVDAGWRVLWRLQLLHNPNFDSLREEPAFRDLVERLEEDMRQQLLKVRAMEASGEIPAPPRG